MAINNKSLIAQIGPWGILRGYNMEQKEMSMSEQQKSEATINPVLGVLEQECDKIRELWTALREFDFEEALKELGLSADDLDEMDINPDTLKSAAETARMAEALIGCLRRLLVGRTKEEIRKAFGAPGDYGRDSSLGAALDAYYHFAADASAPAVNDEITRAILEEREACAKIADLVARERLAYADNAQSAESKDFYMSQLAVVEGCASRIRRQEKPAMPTMPERVPEPDRITKAIAELVAVENHARNHEDCVQFSAWVDERGWHCDLKTHDGRSICETETTGHTLEAAVRELTYHVVERHAVMADSVEWLKKWRAGS